MAHALREARDSPWTSWLEAEAPLGARCAVVAAAALLSARAAGGAGLVAQAGSGALGAAYAALLAFPRARLGDVAMAVAPCAAIAGAGLGALGLDDPWAPFVAQAPGQMALLGLRALVMLLLVLRVAPAGAGARARASWFGLTAVAALLLASLVARGYVLVEVVAGALVARRCASPARASSNPPAVWALVGLLVVVAWGMRPRPRAAAPVGAYATPRAAVDGWNARRNPFRARAAAFDWAKRESPPGEAYVALARADRQIGHPELARKVLAKVIAGSAPEEVRREASDLARGWSKDAP